MSRRIAALEARFRGRLLRSGLGPDGRLRLAWWLWRVRWALPARRRRADLQRFEEQRHSQHGEDGIIGEILARIGVAGPGMAVEIGAGDGSENCTRALVDRGWRAVWIEADESRCAAARARGLPAAVVVTAAVDAENIADLLAAAEVPERFDVLSIDIDGNDYQVLEKVLPRWRPSVIVAEYNGSLGGPSWWVQPYDPARTWDGTARHGMGLRAACDLTRSHGYALIGCDSSGTNAFFVRDELVAGFDSGSAGYHFAPPAVRLPFGHPWRMRPGPEPSAADDDVALRVRRRVRATPGGVRWLPVVVHNRGAIELHSASADRPVLLATRWRGAPGDPVRAPQSWRAAPGRSAIQFLRVVAPAQPGDHVLDIFAVQEGVRWFGGWPIQPLGVVVVTVRPRGAGSATPSGPESNRSRANVRRGRSVRAALLAPRFRRRRRHVNASASTSGAVELRRAGRGAAETPAGPNGRNEAIRALWQHVAGSPSPEPATVGIGRTA